MEASLASGLSKIAGEKLVSLIASEFAAITGVKKDLIRLQGIHGEITSLISTVRDQSMENDPRFHWVIELKQATYDIDDLLYEVYLQAEKHEIDSYQDKHAIADCFCSKRKSFLFRLKVAQKIKAINVTLAAIMKQRIGMNAIGHNVPRIQPTLSRNRVTEELSMLTHVEESQIPTRDQEKVRIINKLVESNEWEDGWIVSVVGLGGSGKTTLAKHICHDNKIKEQFKDTIYWVHVSQEFDVKHLIGKLFEAITKKKSDLHAQQYMVDEISRKLTSAKFLLVLDDAWHQDKEDWKKFMVNLRSRAAGSKLMITTRDRKVAEAVKSGHIFDLAYLSEAESWSLFLNNSEWADGDLGSNFVLAGKDIVNKCGGVPLAIKTIGGILSENREISTWRAISRSNLWNEENTERRVFASLKLSYIHLKDQLKQCFAFCSIFPKGYTIRKNYLIEQWIAHGFVKQMMDDEPEVIGSEYFNSLVKVGFLENSIKRFDGSRIVYKMHDLIHDLTRYILQSEVAISLSKNMTKDHAQKCRYMSLTSCSEKVEGVYFDKIRALYISEGSPPSHKVVKKSRHVSSIVLDCAYNARFPLFLLKLKLDYLGYLEIRNVECKELREVISGCCNLQSLHFICCGFATLPESIGKLKKLRTLELISTDLKSLPQSIGECSNIKTINLEDCWKLVELPRGITNLKRLELLNLYDCYNLNWMPSGFEQLTSLKRLDKFVVGCGSNDARMSALENLDMISGDLEIKNLQHLMDSSDVEKACLEQKKNIRNLTLHWSASQIEEESVLGLGVLDALRPPSEIGKLKIDGYPGAHLPNWMCKESDSSYYLEGAALRQTSQPRFLCLFELVMSRMPNLKHMRGILVLPSLKDLQLVGMPNLEELWSTTSGLEIGEDEVGEMYCFPALSRLEISNCPKLIVEPYYPPSLESLILHSPDGGQQVPPGRSFFRLLPRHVEEPSSSSRSFAAVPRLKELSAFGMNGSASDWGFLQHLPTLETLNLLGCTDLTELPESMRGLTSLRNLWIYGFSTLASLPEWLGELRSLQDMNISNCQMMDSLPRSIEQLTSLRILRIRGWDNLKQLPEAIQHVTSLQDLSLQHCRSLTVLPEWIGQLSMLQRLEIYDCPALQSLPSSIQCLTALQQLDISGCPDLARRYKKNVGNDWHLVSHIPSVWIP